MPRNNGRGSVGPPRRPTVSSTPASRPQQSRPSTTAAYPQQSSSYARPPATSSSSSHAAPAAPAQTAGSGSSLVGNMVSTAVGATAGSVVGHAVSNFLFGDSSSHPVEASPTASPANAGVEQQTYKQSGWENTAACQNDISRFRKCMDENNGSLSICGWYLDQLKACQDAAANY